jgi:hypothetical protein
MVAAIVAPIWANRTCAYKARSEAAIECFRKSLQVAPDYVDAMFNLPLLLQR